MVDTEANADITSITSRQLDAHFRIDPDMISTRTAPLSGARSLLSTRHDILGFMGRRGRSVIMSTPLAVNPTSPLPPLPSPNLPTNNALLGLSGSSIRVLVTYIFTCPRSIVTLPQPMGHPRRRTTGGNTATRGRYVSERDPNCRLAFDCSETDQSDLASNTPRKVTPAGPPP
ncbi:unnamed protein product, partial [Rhizoctonia solani]